jgi:probable rRNA maturation factor
MSSSNNLSRVEEILASVREAVAGYSGEDENPYGVTISVKLTGDEEIKALNFKYRNKDSPTDVLSFEIDHQSPEGTLHLGEVVVDVEQAARQASEYDNDLEHEIADLVSHGVLHLLGVDHDEQGRELPRGDKKKPLLDSESDQVKGEKESGEV